MPFWLRMGLIEDPVVCLLGGIFIVLVCILVVMVLK